MISGSSAGRDVKSVSWSVSCKMEVIRVEEMECYSELVEVVGNNE